MVADSLSHLEIYRLLAKNNCGRCQLPSCLAFAAAAASGQKKLSDCPLLDEQTKQQLTARLSGKPEQELYRFVKDLSELEQQILGLNLSVIAPRIGGTFQHGRLVIKSLGKEFQIDQQGQVHSECHLIPWVKAPLLAYAASPQHQEITGRWLNFRDLPGGMERQNLFTSRCERLLKELADQHLGLLHDLAELFHGTKAEGFEADTTLILYPLPHFPILISWQAPEDGLDSSLTILFDVCCGVNLPAQMAFSLCIGLAQMFGKIALLHR
ncbi:MAG: putative Fe-S cluster [Candidatus Electronema aureum]|uniref:Fe-S cluster n=1 Tax=Candidatus Electronema aureum TaxID=2005002 RepID=A0A521FYY4_9BACT|nr:MAG: putative Fe-S cluster [Candidatus Electronema aureum]